ncbi:aspartate/glutamate racemase family protein [Pannonibacter phragmitetus]|uniref:aspartate/glutamate racemase family protein n=1 Tax=Pannonibacter phragmitetus TaxID=121719 RepID=UPI000B96618C|nr:aspartate/glutamate racemase family protein [Pannonibacter phragmitetus]
MDHAAGEAVPPLGIIMLDTAFERPPGDVGNAASWPFPVLYQTVSGATARKVVGGDDADLLDAFVAAGEALQGQGAVALITSCGFLAARQPVLAARLSLPVATSSLSQIPVIASLLPKGRTVGVITYDGASLGPAHFAGVGADPATPVAGLPQAGAFRGLIEGGAAYDAPALQAELEAVAERLIAEHPSTGALLLECTNLPPFSSALRQRFGLPVFDILTLGRWLHQAVCGQI